METRLRRHRLHLPCRSRDRAGAVPVNHGSNDYSVAHGTRIYYIARDGSMKGFGDYADAPAQMIKAFKEFQ